jgi:hypothetical protein
MSDIRKLVRKLVIVSHVPHYRRRQGVGRMVRMRGRSTSGGSLSAREIAAPGPADGPRRLLPFTRPNIRSAALEGRDTWGAKVGQLFALPAMTFGLARAARR